MQKLRLLADAFVPKEVADERESIHVISDALPKWMQKDLRELVFQMDEDVSNLDLTYLIMSDAADAVAGACTTREEVERLDAHEASINTASVYTSEQHGYLNAYNSHEIAEIAKEYEVDSIGIAAAIWYGGLMTALLQLD
jgi:hypothetical protein